MQRNWQTLNSDVATIDRISRELEISPFLARLVVNRGIYEPEEGIKFLDPKISDLHSPFLFKDMEKAVGRIKKALSCKEKILIYGDYDVDGITAMAVLIKTIKNMGGDVVFYIPHRIEEGYGISKQGIKFALDKKVSLVITVDCGISNVSEIECLAKKGIEVIVTDHHEPDIDNFPLSASVVLNPSLPNETYPERYLSGVGVAFKLAEALLGGFDKVEYMLDLAALGTVADVSLLRGENRILVKYGLSKIGEADNLGIKALMEAADLNKKTISARDIGFILGPRINAMGRLGSAEQALKLFLTDSIHEASEIAKVLNAMNRRRQEIESEIYNSAVNRIEREVNFKNEHAIVLGDSVWHQGVLGIVAGKLAERYSRPTILFSLNNKTATGSGRAKFGGIHLFRLLDKCRHLLIAFGGHKSACGLKMKEELMPEFKSELNRTIREEINEETFASLDFIDTELDFSKITPSLFEDLDRLAPFGEGNTLPTFITRGLRLKNNISPKNQSAWVTDGKWTYEARGRDFQSWLTLLPQGTQFDLVYNLRLLNNYAQERILLAVQDFEAIKEDSLIRPSA